MTPFPVEVVSVAAPLAAVHRPHEVVGVGGGVVVALVAVLVVGVVHGAGHLLQLDHVLLQGAVEMVYDIFMYRVVQ